MSTTDATTATWVECTTCGGDKDPTAIVDVERQRELHEHGDDAGDIVDSRCNNCDGDTGQYRDAWSCSECGAWVCEDCWNDVGKGGPDGGA